MKAEESYEILIEYDVTRIVAARPNLFWEYINVKSNQAPEVSKDVDRSNDNGNEFKNIVQLRDVSYSTLFTISCT